MQMNGNCLKVVHEQMIFHGLRWQDAHELMLIYLEVVETAPSGSSLSLSNVYDSGGQDMYRERAMMRAKSAFGKKGDEDQDIFRGDATTWNGQFTSTGNAKPCFTFNLGRKSHPSNALFANGCCKFNHICDHFVSDKGPNGICGSTKHGRSKCDNPNRVDKPVT